MLPVASELWHGKDSNPANVAIYGVGQTALRRVHYIYQPYPIKLLSCRLGAEPSRIGSLGNYK